MKKRYRWENFVEFYRNLLIFYSKCLETFHKPTHIKSCFLRKKNTLGPVAGLKLTGCSYAYHRAVVSSPKRLVLAMPVSVNIWGRGPALVSKLVAVKRNYCAPNPTNPEPPPS